MTREVYIIKKSNIKRNSFIISFSVIFFSIIVGFVILFDESRPDYYTFLPLLPFCFALTCLFFLNIFKSFSKKLPYFLLISLYMVRNVVTPLLMRFGDYYGAFTLLYNSNINGAITLMIYETFVVFGFLFFLNRKTIHYSRTFKVRVSWSKKKMHLFGFFLFILITFCVIAYTLVPEIRGQYKTIFNEGGIVEGFITNKMFMVGSLNRILFTLFGVIFGFLKIYISVWLICFIRKKFNNTMISIILSIIIILAQFLFMTGSDSFTLITVLILCIVMYKIYKKKHKIVFLLLGIIIIIGPTAIFILRSSSSYATSSLPISQTLSYMFQAYFPGVSNIAGVYNINNPNKLSTLFFDFYEMIPFRNTLFGLSGDGLAVVYTKSNMALSHIIPCVGQAYYYLGAIFAPIVPCTFVYIANKCQAIYRDENNIWKYVSYLLLCIYAAITPIMYNFTIFGSRFLVTILPMLILSKCSSNTFTFDKIIK